MTFRQNFFLQDWFRNKLGVELGLGVGLELVFEIGLVSVKPRVKPRCFVTFCHSEASEVISSTIHSQRDSDLTSSSTTSHSLCTASDWLI
jgi:hypothetical protein